MRVALLEDDVDQVALFTEWLKAGGHTCEHFDTAKSFGRNIKHDSYDALSLAWMVPDMDGFEVLRWVRENFDWPIPIIFVTAKDSEDDIVRALEQGADDYVVKPAKQRELIERVNAIVRRAATVEEGQATIEQDPFVIDLGNHQIQRDGEKIEVTQKEYELIVFLFRNIGRVLSRAHILESVWGRNPDINTRTVDTHVSRIRSKLALAPDTGWKLSSIYQHGSRP